MRNIDDVMRYAVHQTVTEGTRVQLEKMASALLEEMHKDPEYRRWLKASVQQMLARFHSEFLGHPRRARSPKRPRKGSPR